MVVFFMHCHITEFRFLDTSLKDKQKISSQITSQNAQLKAPLSPCKVQTAGRVSTLTCIVVGHPQQTPLWWKAATAEGQNRSGAHN